MTARKPVAPFYAVAVLWLVYSLLFPLFLPRHFILLAIASAVTMWGVSSLCKSGAAAVKEAKEEEPKKAETTGNPELDKMMADGEKAISEMKRLDLAIEDEGISADIVRMEQISEKIFREVKEEPKKLPQIRKFMDYYLPTALKLLNAYDRASGTGISGENVDATKTRVEGMMKTIVSAFEKQLDALYGTEALDISADITVLETMMAREGLIGEQLKAQTMPADNSGIRLEL